MKYKIETYGRKRGDDMHAVCNTLSLAIKIAKKMRAKLETLKEYDVYVDVYESRNEKLVREGFMCAQMSYISGEDTVYWEGKRV